MIESISLHFLTFQNIALAQILVQMTVECQLILSSTERKADVAEW